MSATATMLVRTELLARLLRGEEGGKGWLARGIFWWAGYYGGRRPTLSQPHWPSRMNQHGSMAGMA